MTTTTDTKILYPRHEVDWPAGPWMEEPDRVLWKDPASGLDCLMRRNPMGAWCGYVGVGPSHPAHGQGIYEIDVSVHGGVTYAEPCQEDAKETGVCHVPAPGEPEHLWWIGFDCAHAGDRVPSFGHRAAGYDVLTQLTDGLMGTMTGSGEEYRDQAYVKAEVEKLAGQLKELG